MTILIIAAADDAHVPYVTQHLIKADADFVCFDPQDFPSRVAITVDYSQRGFKSLLLQLPDRTIDLQALTSVWNRARVRPKAPTNALKEQQWWIEESATRFLSELYECINCLWVPERPESEREPFRLTNPPNKEVGANPHRAQHPSPHNKLYQLQLAATLGFAIPPTRVTNDPDALLDFYESSSRPLISKKAIPLANWRHGERVQAYTHPVKPADIIRYQSVRYTPVVFQENVAKHCELRVTVVGDQVFSAAIDSHASHRVATDWRHYLDVGGERMYSIHTLPQEVHGRCIQLLKSLGLCYGAIDLILTPDGEYVFLEINPGGQWGWIENYTGLPISQAVAQLLMHPNQTIHS